MLFQLAKNRTRLVVVSLLLTMWLFVWSVQDLDHNYMYVANERLRQQHLHQQLLSLNISNTSSAVVTATNINSISAISLEHMERPVERLNSLRSNCLKEKLSTMTELLRTAVGVTMLTDQRRNFFYCLVPKVACTSIKSALISFNGGSPDVDPHSSTSEQYFTRFFRLSVVEQREILDNSFKFMFVRHPFERLVSAYIDKFVETRQPHYQHYVELGKTIRSLYRQPRDNVTADFANRATFVEFVRFLLDRKTRRPYADFHWRPYTEMCQPCSIHYDYIGRFETLQDDAEFILNKLGIKQQVQFQKLNSARRQNNTADVVDRYFSQLRPSDVEKLKEIYRLDFALFGYRYFA